MLQYTAVGLSVGSAVVVTPAYSSLQQVLLSCLIVHSTADSVAESTDWPPQCSNLLEALYYYSTSFHSSLCSGCSSRLYSTFPVGSVVDSTIWGWRYDVLVCGTRHR